MANLLTRKKEQKISALTIFAIATFGLHFLVLLIFLVQGLNIRLLLLCRQLMVNRLIILMN
jgi:hypothetical protein